MHPLCEDTISMIKEILFPVSCLNCQKPGEFICTTCRSNLRRITRQSCIVCQQPAEFGLTHSGCRQNNPLTADQIISILDYHDPLVSQTIIAGKYKLLPDVFRLFGRIIGQHITEPSHENLRQSWSDAVITFIPLAPRRHRWRNFNQSELLAKELAVQFGRQATTILTRSRMVKVQKELTREERRHNLQNSFSCRSGATIKNKKILLIDDVVTTGTTLMEAAKVLKTAGAASVFCLTLAQD